MDYHKCIACQKGQVLASAAENRVRLATEMLRKYLRAKDQYCVRFSNKVHFGQGLQGKLRIIRWPRERYCPNCLQEGDQLEEKDKKRFHCQAAISYNFKLNIHFYNVLSNTNGKMSLQVYRDYILELIVKPQLAKGEDFVLEEDNDSGHSTGKGKGNIVRKQKEENGLECYFNCAQSLDLSPIKNCQIVPKGHLRKVPHQDNKTTKELIIKGQAKVSQRFINDLINTIPQRLQDVIDSNGKLTGY